MPYLSQITHPTESAQKKVNFFADYFRFASTQIGYYDGLEIENILSLIEKIIYQASQNLERCPQYLNSYLTHPLLSSNNKYFKEFKSYRSVKYYFAKYNNAGSDGQKVNWIRKTPKFLKSLSIFKSELSKSFFKRAVKANISYLKCKHDLDEHEDDIVHYTNVIVSEFLLNNRSKSDLANVFEKIITREIKDFPFPKSLLDRNKGNNLSEAKSEFMKNRSFDQQFDGIYNIFKQSHSKHIYLFRIYNISSVETFLFKYDKVTFYHPKHEKLKQLVIGSQKDVFMKEFFNQEQMLIAAVKVEYYSSEIAESDAVKIILQELPYLNKICTSNAYLERNSYLITSNFKTFGGRWSIKEKAYILSDSNIEQLNDNPYRFLNKINKDVKGHLLKQEPLFLTAINSNNISDYWQYLETLIKPSHKKVIDTVSTILLLNANQFHQNTIINYIKSSIFHFPYPESLIGLTRERQLYFQKQLNLKNELDIDKIIAEMNHPFLNYLGKLYSSGFSKEDYARIKQIYMRLLVEAYAQRNAETHKGQANEKPLISLYYPIPRLIIRLRWLLFGEIKKKKVSTFGEALENLKLEGQKLF